jgi:hypothetical protein
MELVKERHVRGSKPANLPWIQTFDRRSPTGKTRLAHPTTSTPNQTMEDVIRQL